MCHPLFCHVLTIELLPIFYVGQAPASNVDNYWTLACPMWITIGRFAVSTYSVKVGHSLYVQTKQAHTGQGCCLLGIANVKKWFF